MNINRTPAWQALEEHYRQTRAAEMRNQFAAEPDRFARMHETLHGMLLDFSKNRISEETLTLLCRLAEEAGLAEKTEAMRRGDIINTSEKRAVLHTALRLPADAAPVYVNGENVVPKLHRELDRALSFAEKVINGEYTGTGGERITDLVHIGIGGSDLGPLMVTLALTPYQKGVRVHFVSNADDAAIAQVLPGLNPRTTLFSIASKSFGTPETLLNAHAARDWFLAQGMTEADIKRHFVAISTNMPAVEQFGISAENTFAMFDWVGGRYSVWSAIGLPVMVAVGADNFRAFLAGAHAMDEHFFNAPYRRNIPVLLALLGIWYSNFYGAASHAVIPYSHFLRRLPAHLQQLDMESNGKHVTYAGTEADYQTGPIIWGEEGVNCQHAFFQLIHQGTRLIPVDFIAPVTTPYNIGSQHRFLVANAFAQAEALMRGKTVEEARAALPSDMPEAERDELALHNEFGGNRPSNTILLDKLDPFTLGMLLAMYEHKVFVQGAVWNINSFDQWGVEYGKVLAKTIQRELSGEGEPQHDSSTDGLIAYYRNHQCN
ncbi:MAG: glucose-6-phosphate isomerase [Neisseria sp.]|uniref:glucose-6-phosphate isomerase n=1 Tax=Neisseria sp. TaxID=192066 RepID=UPI0026DA6F86|nr:glucose-6-phosphate isomerase [Neisseria sp.]MDO4249116.1 glucose-6-phosphate isomerase [Neisseria sp.]